MRVGPCLLFTHCCSPIAQPTYCMTLNITNQNRIDLNFKKMNNEQWYLLRFDCLRRKVFVFWLFIMQNGFSYCSFHFLPLSERISREELVPTKTLWPKPYRQEPIICRQQIKCYHYNCSPLRLRAKNQTVLCLGTVRMKVIRLFFRASSVRAILLSYLKN